MIGTSTKEVSSRLHGCAFAAEEGLRPIIRVVVEEGPAPLSSFTKDFMRTPSPGARIFSSYGQSHSVSGGTTIQVGHISISARTLSGRKGSSHRECDRGGMGADGRVESPMGGPEPPLRNGVWGRGHPEKRPL